MLDNNFKEVDFCKDCVCFVECNSSKYDIKLLEQYMIFTALRDTESLIEKKFNEIFKNPNYLLNEVRDFMEDKKENCIYFNNRKDI
ncbi:MAG: hypothetical protein KAJ49_10460 [Arcobacteraceae bacterium]|nr:hypothetical protein [Arcobacteraceae bacterium]